MNMKNSKTGVPLLEITAVVVLLLWPVQTAQGISIAVNHSSNATTCGSLVCIECKTEGDGVVFYFKNATSTQYIADCQFAHDEYAQLINDRYNKSYNIELGDSTCILTIKSINVELSGTYICTEMYAETNYDSRNVSCNDETRNERPVGGSKMGLIIGFSVLGLVVVVSITVGLCCYARKMRNAMDVQLQESTDEGRSLITDQQTVGRSVSVGDKNAPVPSTSILEATPDRSLLSNLDGTHTTYQDSNSKPTETGVHFFTDNQTICVEMKDIQCEKTNIQDTDTCYETSHDDSSMKSSSFRDSKTEIKEDTNDEPNDDWPMENTYTRETTNEDSIENGRSEQSTNLENDHHDWPPESAFARDSMHDQTTDPADAHSNQ